MNVHKKVVELMDVALDECRRALLEVVKALPDKEQDSTKVLERALEFVHVNGDAGEQARVIVTRFVRACPRCYGVERTNCYWRTLNQFFRRLEVLDLYLERFPEALTQSQRESLRKYLIRQKQYSLEEVEMSLMRFKFRPNQGVRAPGATRGTW